MKQIVDDFAELSDSRELLTAREPNFIILITFLVVVFTICAFIWMWFGEVDIVVKARGIVRPAINVSIIRNMYSGKINKIYLEQGKTVKKDEILLEIKSRALRLKKKNIRERIEDINNKIKDLIHLKKCITNGEQFINRESNCYNRYLLYKTKYEQLRIKYIKADDRYKREKMLGSYSTTESELKKIKLNYKNAKLDLNRFKKENVAQINKEVSNLQIKFMQLKSQLLDINKNISSSYVKAPITGNVELLENLNSGDYIPAGLKIAKIIPAVGVNYKMVITVKNRDISKLKEGQIIKYRFISLPYKEYGVSIGKISEIASDVSVEDKSNLNYKIEATINNTKLVSNKGKIKYIKTGMLSETRIITGRKKILYYILEKLDFIS